MGVDIPIPIGLIAQAIVLDKVRADSLVLRRRAGGTHSGRKSQCHASQVVSRERSSDGSVVPSHSVCHASLC